MKRLPFSKGIPSDTATRPEDYFEQLERWLEWEAEAERERMAERRRRDAQQDPEAGGETLLNLDLVDHHTGLGGRYLLDFSKPSGADLPMNRLKVGSPVVVSFDRSLDDTGIAGVISHRKRSVIQVATESFPSPDERVRPVQQQMGARGIGLHGKANRKRSPTDNGNLRYRLDLSPDETTRLRQLAAMAKARTAMGRAARLRNVLLLDRAPSFDGKRIDDEGMSDLTRQELLAEIDFLSDLNVPQQEAVAFALAADDVAIVHGPPGTGKTTTLAEIIAQAVARGDRVLACAASNTAVDNLLEKTLAVIPASHTEQIVRIGHPARVHALLHDHTLDARVEADPNSRVVLDLRRELDEVLRVAQKRPRSPDGFRRRGELFAEAGQLRGQIRSLERQVVRDVIKNAEVVCATTTLDEELLGKEHFDLAVIDEACQCSEAGIWQAVNHADRVILAGDHCQLPPTVLSDQASQTGMKQSTMQRLILRYGNAIYQRLKVQYRMHEAIMRFPSEWFYDGDLLADTSVRTHRLCDLDTVTAQTWTTEPLCWIDTAGASFDEQQETDGLSRWNPGEVRLVETILRDLTAAGLSGHQIAVITPYAGQVRALRDRLHMEALEIDTVDGFQGREKEVVILSTVRSNATGEIGFLSDTRRTNVAITRAKRSLVIIGDSATLGRDPFYEALLERFEDQGAYRSCFEFAT
ncbi:MAG: AAA domain-containing protein [Planctomycetota bacterium]